MNQSDKDTPSPDKYYERDVTDLRVEVVKFDERIRNIKDSMVTKELLAKSRLDTAKWMLQLFIPVFAAVLGAFIMTYFN